MPLTRDQILASDDLEREPLEIPEWGGTVFVKVMTAGERDKFEERFTRNRYDNTRAALAVACVCDEAGKPLFTDADIPALAGKSAAALQHVFDAAARLNALTKDDVDAMEKNSASVPPAGSSSVLATL